MSSSWPSLHGVSTPNSLQSRNRSTFPTESWNPMALYFFYRQLCCLVFSQRFWPKIKQLLSNYPASDWTTLNAAPCGHCKPRPSTIVPGESFWASTPLNTKYVNKTNLQNSCHKEVDILNLPIQLLQFITNGWISDLFFETIEIGSHRKVTILSPVVVGGDAVVSTCRRRRRCRGEFGPD